MALVEFQNNSAPYLNANNLNNNFNYCVPTGGIVEFAGSTAPNGWLICDGSAVSRETYADLFTLISTTYGTGDGSTTFNLPDYRGRVGVGKSSDTEFDTLGETGGEKTHTLTVNEMPAHNHDFRYTFKAASGTSEWVGNNVNYNEIGNVIGNKGGDQPHNNLQPYIVTNYIIKY